MGTYQVLLLQVRVGLEAMAMKGYSASSKVPALLQYHHQIVYCHIQDTWDEVGTFYNLNRLGLIWPV